MKAKMGNKFNAIKLTLLVRTIIVNDHTFISLLLGLGIEYWNWD